MGTKIASDEASGAAPKITSGEASGVAPKTTSGEASGVAPKIASGEALGAAPKITRDEALRAALREVGAPSGPDAKDRERRRYLGKAWRAEAVDFVRSIAATAALIEQARELDGELVLRTDVCFSVLSALERIGGDPSIAELARALRIAKQSARRNVIVAARAGSVELLPDPYDRRSIRIALTPSGRRELAAAHAREFAWVVRLLNGLGTREMKLVAHVLRVLRRRLQRDRQLLLAAEPS